MRGTGSSMLAAAMALCLAVPAQAAKPLPLHPRPLGVPGPPPSQPRAFASRYVVSVTDRAAKMRDDTTAREYEQQVPSPGCFPTAVRFPELLLECQPPTAEDGPKVVNMIDGRVLSFRSATSYPNAREPFAFGVAPDDAFFELGHRWVGGRYSDIAAKGAQSALYLDRQTGRRVLRPLAPAYDLDSPDLAVKPQACAGPGRTKRFYFGRLDPSARTWLWLRTTPKDHEGDLILQRCGRPGRLISRCPSWCRGARFTRRFVTWTNDRGDANVRSRRTGRAYTLRPPWDGYPGYSDYWAVSATDRRMLVTTRTGAPDSMHRTVEVPLPRSIR